MSEDYDDYLANLFLQCYVLVISVYISMIMLPGISSIEIHFLGVLYQF